VIGVAAAWVQLGERPSPGEAAGMALILGALAIVTVRGLIAGRRAAATVQTE
jgi:drug/metabolite transporter (DMT)-like permease